MSSSIWRKELFEGSAAEAAARLWAWWRGEFFALFSPATLAFLLDRGERRLMLRVGETPIALHLVAAEDDEPAPPILPDEIAASSLDAVLAARGVTREATKIVVELPRESFFVRRFDAPAAALADLPRLLTMELERKTPFKPADVLHGHVIAGRAGASHGGAEKIGVEQWILRRDLIARAVEGSSLSVEDVDLVQPRWPHGEPTSPPAMRVRDAATEGPDREGRIALGAAVLALTLFAVGVGVAFWRQEQEMAAVEEAIAAASTRAAGARQIADRAATDSRLLATLREERAKNPTFAELWEEVSRILPDGAHAAELRLTDRREGGRSIELNGFADSAASLPALFDRSALFSDAKLTAPITPDPIEKRESFSLQANIRSSK
ncbi:PilN domain-containing protein [Methylosinus sp. Sm6]|uniref:PilN domain-containing protein n=1 Tax=Methylosinus sp. Sm6 TaxID=2866948 RepID=UPI001C993CA0|nr:PilN domain-containing protein [Methylosinus sp. Sm6]MBY6242703.1 PilN domain-containing protein [Methylosinus sp. Sm6]